MAIKLSAIPKSNRRGHYMSASTTPTLSLEHDGFAVVEDVTDLDDIGVIHQAIENCLHRDDVKTRELGERGGAPQIIEIARPCLLAEEISRSLFFRNAKAFSETRVSLRSCDYQATNESKGDRVAPGLGLFAPVELCRPATALVAPAPLCFGRTG